MLLKPPCHAYWKAAFLICNSNQLNDFEFCLDFAVQLSFFINMYSLLKIYIYILLFIDLHLAINFSSTIIIVKLIARLNIIQINIEVQRAISWNGLQVNSARH